MKIAVVGGGICGLTASYLLSLKKHEISLFEKEKTLGGLASSFKNTGWKWPVERYFHHYFTSDKELKELLARLDLLKNLKFYKPKTSVYLNNKIFRFDNPKSIILFPELNLPDKLRTAATSVFLKINPFYQFLEKIPAVKFIEQTMGKNALEKIWQPLLIGKFGSFSRSIPASWFWTRINKRSFSLGYLDRGTETLIQQLAEEISNKGGKIYLGNKITKVFSQNNQIEIFSNNKSLGIFDKVILNVSPHALGLIVSQLSSEEKQSLNELKSIGSLCLLLELKEQFLIDKTYWLNINDANFPFVAVVEHTNLIDSDHYNKHHLVYVGGYYPTSHPFFKKEKQQIYQKFLPFLRKINPEFNFKSSTLDYNLFSDFYSQPIIPLNYSKIIPSLRTSVPNLFWASLHHVYPQDRGVNYAVRLGKIIADEIQNN